MFEVFTFNGGGYAANTYVLSDKDSGDAILFDPSCPPAEMADFFSANGMTLRYIVLTHAHYDHMLKLNETREYFPDVPVLVGKGDEGGFTDSKVNCAYLFGIPAVDFGAPDKTITEGDELTLGDSKVSVISTPGHTPGCCCFIAGDIMITGDTLFEDSIGRSDFIGGDLNILIASLKRLMSLDRDYEIYPGHGPSSTLSLERRHNPFILQIINR